MAAITTSGTLTPEPADSFTGEGMQHHRRRIGPRAKRALEILSHAIEYLTDELVQADDLLLVRKDQIEAIQLLMAMNRQVYLECPEAPSLGERWRALLHPNA